MDLMLALEFVLALAVAFWSPCLAIAAFKNSVNRGRQSGGFKWGIMSAAALGALSLFLRPGSSMGQGLAAFWLAATLYIAFLGAKRLALWGLDDPGQWGVSLGSMLLPVGATWMLASRGSSNFLGFDEPWKVLTAIHFHYSAFLTLVSTGLLISTLDANSKMKKIYALTAPLYAGGLFFVAIGLQGHRNIEILGVAGMAISGSLMFLSLAIHSAELRLGAAKSAVLKISLSAGTAALLLALLYQFRFPWLQGIDQMAETHGFLQAFVLVPGLMLAALTTSKAQKPGRERIPFSCLKGGVKIGPDFFKNFYKEGPSPQGLVDHFSAFDRPEFDSKRIALEVVDFYENTTDYSLQVSAIPAPWFASIWKKFFGPLFSRLGQLRLPDHEKEIRGEIRGIHEPDDVRKNSRAWIRTDRSTGDPVYIAAYALHSSDGETYMNIAFPLPYCNMTSILKVSHLDLSGVRLDSRMSAAGACHQGVFLAIMGLAIRLPLNETIDVWADAGPTARHTMWIFGKRYLTLEYTLRKK